MKRNFFIWLTLLFLLPGILAAQDIPDIEKILEGNDILDSEDGYEDMVGTLEQLSRKPLNVNTAGFDSLKMLFFLSDSQIDNILAFRKKYGVFLHLNELLLVTGIGRKDLENITPFLTTGNVSFCDRTFALNAVTKHEMLLRVQSKVPRTEGYKTYLPEDFKTKREYEAKLDNRFQGPPLGALVKYKLAFSDRIQAGITLENDPGEAFFTKSQRSGFDFLSAHFYVRTERLVRKLLIGDYRIQWGQGLLVWQGFSSGKSSMVVANEKSAQGFAPYTSTNEHDFFRGMALSLAPLKNLVTDVFIAVKKADADLLLGDTLADEDLLTASIHTTGLHRNNLECRKKNNLDERSAGVAVKWNMNYFRIGANVLYYDFKPGIHVGDLLYQQYNDDGVGRFFTSVDYKTGFQSIYFFGETAISDNGTVATLNGLRFSSPKVSLCMLYRRYDKRYISRYSGGFGEYSNTSNEEGIYLGVDIVPVRRVKINAYYDWFRFFAPRYNAFVPAPGREILCEVTYEHPKFEHTFRFKNEEKPENSKTIKAGVVERVKNDFRYQLNYMPDQQIELRSRLSYCQYKKAGIKENGYMISQDFIYSALRNPFKMQFRLAWFDVDSYNSRIYAYENNVLYAYSFPSFMDRGWRTYLNLSWKVSNVVTFYLKTGFVIYPGKSDLSSGLTRVDGNKQSDLTFQVRIKI